MERYPVRAIRLLAEADGAAAELLDGHVRANPELAAAAPAEVREIIDRVLDAAGRVPEAPAEAPPRLLVDPPRTRPQRTDTPAVIKGLAAPDIQGVAWAPGEQADWAQTGISY